MDDDEIEGHGVVGCPSASSSAELTIFDRFGGCGVLSCWENIGNVDDRNSKMKRKRNTRQRRATLRVHVNCVLDLMLF